MKGFKGVLEMGVELKTTPITLSNKIWKEHIIMHMRKEEPEEDEDFLERK